VGEDVEVLRGRCIFFPKFFFFVLCASAHMLMAAAHHIDDSWIVFRGHARNWCVHLWID